MWRVRWGGRGGWVGQQSGWRCLHSIALNVDWLAPTSMILGSDLKTGMASHMVGFKLFSDFDPPSSSPPSPPPPTMPPATFSFHRSNANSPPRAMNTRSGRTKRRRRHPGHLPCQHRRDRIASVCHPERLPEAPRLGPTECH